VLPNRTRCLCHGSRFDNFLQKILTIVFKSLNNAPVYQAIAQATIGPLFAIKTQ
jgi:hypothetical protein